MASASFSAEGSTLGMIAWTNALVMDDVRLVILSGFLNFISMCLRCCCLWKSGMSDQPLPIQHNSALDGRHPLRAHPGHALNEGIDLIVVTAARERQQFADEAVKPLGPFWQEHGATFETIGLRNNARPLVLCRCDRDDVYVILLQGLDKTQADRRLLDHQGGIWMIPFDHIEDLFNKRSERKLPLADLENIERVSAT